MAQLAKAGSLYDVGLTALGEAILSEHLRAAALILANATTASYGHSFHHKEHHERMQESVAFVKGTGLDVVIEQFELDLDPESLREHFFSWASRRRTLQASLLSSPTTQVALS